MSIDQRPVGVVPDDGIGPPVEAPPNADPGPGRPGVRARLGTRSLTARLVTGVVLLALLLVCAVGSTTYLALRSFLYNRFDQQLSSTAAQNAGYFQHCLETTQLTPQGYTCRSGPQTDQEWISAVDPASNKVFTFKPDYGNDLKVLELGADRYREVVAHPGRTFVVTDDGTPLRVTSRRTAEGMIFLTGLSTAEVSRTLGRVVAVEFIIGLAAVFLALGATSWGVRRSLRNLYRVTSTARDVASELSPSGSGLERRVPVTEKDTEVGQLAQSFNTMLAAVETQFAARVESEQRMRQFLADASHELRTPLTSIRGYAELARMQRAVQGDVPADNLDRIESEGTRMSRLVEDLLVLARGDAAAAGEYAPVDVAELLDDAVSGSRAAFADRPISIEVEPMPTVFGDRDQLLRVVRNLITNAAVHTAAGRAIQVRGFAGDGGAVVQVIDGGPGLAADEAAHVFERFWRADKARTRARGGSGLGMSIVAAVTAAHGGTVRFDSSVESGSTVTLWLPGATT